MKLLNLFYFVLIVTFSTPSFTQDANDENVDQEPTTVELDTRQKTKETTEKKEIAGHRTPRIGARMAEWHRQLLATRGEEGEEQRTKEEKKTPPARR